MEDILSMDLLNALEEDADNLKIDEEDLTFDSNKLDNTNSKPVQMRILILMGFLRLLRRAEVLMMVKRKTLILA